MVSFSFGGTGWQYWQDPPISHFVTQKKVNIFGDTLMNAKYNKDVCHLPRVHSTASLWSTELVSPMCTLHLTLWCRHCHNTSCCCSYRQLSFLVGNIGHFCPTDMTIRFANATPTDAIVWTALKWQYTWHSQRRKQWANITDDS